MKSEIKRRVAKSVVEAATELATWLPNDLLGLVADAKAGKPADADAIREAAEVATNVAELLVAAKSMGDGGDEA